MILLIIPNRSPSGSSSAFVLIQALREESSERGGGNRGYLNAHGNAIFGTVFINVDDWAPEGIFEIRVEGT